MGSNYLFKDSIIVEKQASELSWVDPEAPAEVSLEWRSLLIEVMTLEKSRFWDLWRKVSTAAAAAKLLQSCPTLCDSIDGTPLGSSVPGILQARILEWVAISFSNAWKWSRSVMPDS